MDNSGLIRAVVDIGTNTFNLLVVKMQSEGFKVLASHKIGVSLGMGGINQARLADASVSRALTAFDDFKQLLSDYNVVPELIATSAVRDAVNASEFISLVHDRYGWDIKVVSGKQEAELIYKGVGLCYGFEEPTTIMDIGGGSTEFIEANKKGIMRAVSLNIGVSRLYQGFSVGDPFSKKDVRDIEDFLESHSNGFFRSSQTPTLIGSSGTFETFFELINQKPFPTGTQLVELDLEPFLVSLDSLIYSTQEERNKNEFIIPIRKRMAPFAAVKTRWVMQQIKPKKILISPYSLKEGVLV